MYNVLTDWLVEVLGGLTVLLVLWGGCRARRRRTAQAASTVGAGTVRTYTLIGARAADGQPVHLPSSKPAGTVVTWTGLSGRERFELTDAELPDGTYVAEREALYGQDGSSDAPR